MTIIIGADLVPTASNYKLFSEANVEALLGDTLKERLQHTDFRIFNLETPLVDAPSPIEKCGPSLCAPTDTIQGIKAIGTNLLTLANNHIMDHGQDGLRSTTEVLTNNGLAFFGAGENVEAAAQPYIIRLSDKTIGILACVEHEFSVAGEQSPGANPFEPLETPDQVAALKAECDYVIVLYHGGKEFYQYPSPELQKTCRKLVEKGADLVVTQHCHCIGCHEEYLHGTIVYGQGNFLFDNTKNEFEATSLLIELNEKGKIGYIPICKRGCAVRMAEADDAEAILRAFDDRSRNIKQPGFLEASYHQFADSFLEHYLLCLHGTNRRGFFYRLMNRLTKNRWKTWIIRRAYNKESHLTIWNYVACEAHRELLMKGLQKDE